MYIDMPTGDSIFSDTKKQFVYVVLSFIVSIVYLKKDWYEYWGLWMMALSFLLFCIFAFGSKSALMEGLLSIIKPDWTTNVIVKPLLWNLAFVPFILIFIALTILVYVSTAIVRKKHEGEITGDTELDNAFRRRAFQLNDLEFFQAYELSEKDYTIFRESFDLLIGAIFSLIGFVYSSQFAELIGIKPITYADINPLVQPRVPAAVDELNKNKWIYRVQVVWLVITLLASTITGGIGVRNAGEGLKLYRRMRD
jgi:hypothetical protein